MYVSKPITLYKEILNDIYNVYGVDFMSFVKYLNSIHLTADIEQTNN